MTVCHFTLIALFMAQLLTDIEAFLAEQGLAPTRFGDAALGDRHFVRQLRDGRRVWPETEKKVRDFMAGYPDQQEAA